MLAIVFFAWLFIATLFVGLLTLRWWYIDKSPTSRETNLGSDEPEPERTAEDYPLQGIDLD
jgi:hypothetical protein